jgi:tetratricopeptide (TPR) repeat protein
MRRRPVTTILILMLALIPALAAQARQNVASIQPAGLAFCSGGVPTAEQPSLPASGQAPTAATAARSDPAPPGETPKKPLNQIQVFALLAGQVPSHRVAMLVRERGIDFEPNDEYLREVRLAGGEDELVSALKSAKVTKPAHVDPGLRARQAEIREHVARGARLLQARQYGAAEAEYRAAVRLDPRNADLHNALGIASINKGDIKREIAEFREALRLDPTNDNAHVNLGVALGKEGDQDGEIAEYRAAIRLDPKNDDARLKLGLALGDKGDLDGEIAEYRDTLRLNPRNENAHFFLGGAFAKRGDWDGAIGEYHQAVRLNPENEDARLQLGAALGQKGDLDGEIAKYREALRLKPNDEDAHIVLGAALAEKGDGDSAIAEFREALRLNPNNGRAHYVLGFSLEQNGDRQGALEEYRAAYELNPHDPEYRQAHERLLHQLKQ